MFHLLFLCCYHTAPSILCSDFSTIPLFLPFLCSNCFYSSSVLMFLFLLFCSSYFFFYSFLCSYCSTLPTFHLFQLFRSAVSTLSVLTSLCSHCSTVLTVPQFLLFVYFLLFRSFCFYSFCSNVSLFLLCHSSYFSSVAALLYLFLFLCSNVCSYGSTVPVSILPLFPPFLFSYCSSVPAVPRFYTFFFYSSSSSCFYSSCSYCPTVPTLPQFLLFPLFLLFPCSHHFHWSFVPLYLPLLFLLCSLPVIPRVPNLPASVYCNQ